MGGEGFTGKSNTRNLRDECNRLNREQNEAMSQAVYVGMTTNEAKE